MAENEAAILIRDYLKSKRFNVERIPEKPLKRADYRVTDGNDVYIIEVKGRIQDKKYRKDLLSGKVACRQASLGRTNPVTKQIRIAAQQLKSTPADSRAFRVIALVAAGDDPDAQFIQFQSTLYGTVDLLVPQLDGSIDPVPCFYFTFNEFFKFPFLDSALILVPGGRRVVCLNPFSPRANEFRNTRLWHLHETEGNIRDPEQLEKRREAFIADCKLKRRDESSLLDFIRCKYELEYLGKHWPQVFKPKRHTKAKIAPRKQF